MALKGTTKFDAPVSTKDASVRKVDAAFPREADRRSFQAAGNRVLGGVGTSGIVTQLTAQLAEGTNVHTVKLTTGVYYTVNGVKYTIDAVDNVAIPGVLGTQGTACYCKYLVSVGTDGTAASGAGGITITKGCEGTAADDAKLPDLPDNNCAIGYFQILTTTFEYVAGSTDNGSTGITDTYADLVHMPFNG